MNINFKEVKETIGNSILGLLLFGLFLLILTWMSESRLENKLETGYPYMEEPMYQGTPFEW